MRPAAGTAAASIQPTAAAWPVKPQLPPPLPSPKKKKPKKEFIRKMPEHMLPPYVEANFRTLMFVLTRAPRVRDFPHEKCAHALEYVSVSLADK